MMKILLLLFVTLTTPLAFAAVHARGPALLQPSGAAWLVISSISGVQLWLGLIVMIRWEKSEQQERQLAIKGLLDFDHHDEDFLDRWERQFMSGQNRRTEMSLLHGLAQRWSDLNLRSRESDQAKMGSDVRLRQVIAECRRAMEIVDAISSPVIAIDAGDEIVVVNQTATDLFGISADPTESRVLHEVVQCREMVEMFLEMTRHQTSLQRVREIELFDVDGTKHLYQATCRMLSSSGESDGQESLGAFAVLCEIDEQKLMQKEHADFVSAVSHEMKTPLAGIKAYVEILSGRDAVDDATRDEFLEVINSQVDRLQRLIDNLLDIARIEAGVVAVSKKAGSLNELLEEAHDVMHPAANRKRIQLSLALSSMYIGVHGDRDMLLQATINLLSNAIKYTSDGGNVLLRSRVEGDLAIVEISDTGIGLSPEDVGRVFEKFFRVGRGRHMAQGTGLGLPLAKHIVEDVHCGTLGVDSEVGQGSVFRMTLPIVKTNTGHVT